ncbi:MAG: hypothetical protein IJX53_03985 [Clostridia bacterium]|nr:hypothetical protein [Clostridia bacterium]
MNLTTIRRVLDSACRIYAVCTLLLCAGQMLFAAEETVIYPLSFFMLFPFALCFAGANLVWRSASVSAGMRFLGHFALLTAGIVLFVFLPAGVFSSGSSALVMVCVYLLLYFLIMLAIAAVKSAQRRQKAERTSSYSAQYAGLRDKK